METGESTYGYRGSRWIKRIVVAADGSPASSRGLEQVADLAPRVGAKVVVVYVRHLPATALMAPGIADPTMVQTLDDQEAEVRQEAVRALGGTGVDWEMVVRAGSPGEEIVQVADESGADLVVVGSNRHSSLHNLLLGSTAAHLTAHSPVPVLVMRSKGRPERQPSPSLVYTTS
jgi:nucleotide-binding universal stress UspA family protein